MRRYETSRGVENWLKIVDKELSRHYESEYLQEFSLRYCTVLSYEKVSGLVSERCGTSRLSDQRLSQMVKEKAEQIKVEQKNLMKEKAATQTEIKAVAVDLYDRSGREIIWLEDGICVSEQKAKRDGQAKRGKERVTTDMAMMQKRDGSFKTLIAGNGVEKECYYKAEILAEYGEEASELPIVAISDGARSIKSGVKRLFGEEVSHLLDWYHVEAKVYQLMTQIAPNKQVKAEVQEQMINELWRGKSEAAIQILEPVKGRNQIKQAELKGYLEKNKASIIDYEKRRETGKIIGSGRMEKENDVIIAHRQKRKGMSWSKTGSLSLAMVTAHFNQRTNYLQ